MLRWLVVVAVLAGQASAAAPDPTDAVLIHDLHALVRSGIAVGVVLNPSVELTTAPPRPSPDPPPVDRRGALAWMASRWADVLAVSDRPVVRIEAAAAARCRAGLAQQIDVSDIGGTAIEVMFGIAKAIDPGLATLPPPGLVQGGGSGSPSRKATVDRVRLTGGRISVEAALDQFVTQLDGWGWWVRERCTPQRRCSCDLGLVTEDSVLFGGYDISPLATR